MAANMSTNESFARNAAIGGRIKLRRLQLGLSRESLGLALGVTFAQVQKYETGAARIGAGRLYQIAAVLKVPVLFFFGGTIGGAEEREDSHVVLDFLDST